MTPEVIKILIVVTSHGLLGDTGKPTGYYLSEVSHPVSVFKKEGFDIDIASPQGGSAPMDENSKKLNDPINKWFLDTPEFINKIENTLPLEKISASKYSAILFAGGHGTMWDFPNNKILVKLTAEIYMAGGVVAAVCHGPAALVNVQLKNGVYLVDGKEVSSFSNAEEEATGLTRIMPFLLESKLIERGAKYTKAPLWEKHVVVSDRLVTGQNPASAQGVGEAVADLLKK